MPSHQKLSLFGLDNQKWNIRPYKTYKILIFVNAEEYVVDKLCTSVSLNLKYFHSRGD